QAHARSSTSSVAAQQTIESYRRVHAEMRSRSILNSPDLVDSWRKLSKTVVTFGDPEYPSEACNELLKVKQL
ncbi:MAG: hypothetical protein AAFU78_17060, partial [Cyanobacteria bacterium J06633_2]